MNDWSSFCTCLCDMGTPIKLGRLGELGERMVSGLGLDRTTQYQVCHTCEQWIICGPSKKVETHQRSRIYLSLIFIILVMCY